MTLIHGDALEQLKKLPANSVDSIVTDPPAGIAFMGKDWDKNKGGRDSWIAWLTEIMQEALRVLKPGGHALVWSLPKTSHWTGTALENAGFEIRDTITHVFGEGFPKSHNISKQIDKAAGAERPVLGISPNARAAHKLGGRGFDKAVGKNERSIIQLTAAVTPAAEQYEGWGTALKPGAETWWLARKPIAASNVAANVIEYGTGAINIDACRVEYANEKDARPKDYSGSKGIGTLQEACKAHGIREYKDGYSYLKNDYVPQTNPKGRWPANIIFSHTLFCEPGNCYPGCPAALLDEQSGYSKDTGRISRREGGIWGQATGDPGYRQGYEDEGGASRYFTQFYYSSKASKKERNAGLDMLPAGQTHRYKAGIGEGFTPDTPVVESNIHPTVKPIKLMRWLVTLITPAGGTVLDMFGGSGTTALACIAEHMDYILIEREAAYIPIIEARIAHAEREIA